VHNKYKVLGKLGSGAFATVHAISMIKGQKQIIRAIKVVQTSRLRRAPTSNNHKLAQKYQCSNKSKTAIQTKLALPKFTNMAMRQTIII